MPRSGVGAAIAGPNRLGDMNSITEFTIETTAMLLIACIR